MLHVVTAKIAGALIVVGSLAGCVADPPAPPPPSSSAPAVVLAPSAYRIAPMPVSPTWQPAGERVHPSFVESRWELHYATARLTLVATYGRPDSYDVHPVGKGTPFPMLGLPGKLYHGVIGDSPVHTLIVVTDERGLSVLVWAYDETLVRRFANGLRWQPLPINAPFEVALLPERFVPVRISSYTMEFTAGPASTDYVAVTLRGDLASDPRATPTTVNGHRAEVFIAADQTWIWVFLDADRTLQIDVAVSLRAGQSTLERLAAGVRVTGYATVWSNP